MLRYTIATGKSETDILSEYGVRVSGTTGLVGKPEFKDRRKYSWPHLHGEWVDLRRRRLKAREITLKCWLKGENKQDAIARMNAFMKAFETDSLIRLRVEFLNTTMIGSNNSLFYLVYLKGCDEPRYKWRTGKQIFQFEIHLKEPSPVKRIYQLDATDIGNVTLACDTPNELDVFWGDGDVNYDVVGDNVTIGHKYSTAGRHYLIVCGVIDEISSLTLTPSTQEITITQLYEEI